MEHLIELVQARLAGGEDFDTIVAECVEIGLCAPEEAEQLREHFTPLIEIGEPDVITSESAAPVIPSERSAPVLHIDWGMEVKTDVILSPEFTIQGCSPECPPLIYFSIDSRIIQDGWQWNKMPTPRWTQKGWSFDQQLELKKVGQYRFRVTLIDIQPGYSDPAYYHSDFRMDVADISTGGQRRKITIQATDGNVLANLDKFGKDADIEVVGSNVTLMARDESSKEQAIHEDVSFWKTTISFQSESDSAKQIPYLSQPNASKMVNLTMMESTGKKRYRLTGGKKLTFGRDVPEQNIRNDVPLEIQPGTQEESEHAERFTRKINNGSVRR